MTEKRKKIDVKINEEKKIDRTMKKIGTRGRIFEGTVIRKFPKRVTIEFEKMTYVPKYERYSKSKTKIHARVPTEIEEEIQVGDLIRIQECRPLSKIIHFIVIKKIKKGEENK